MEEQVVIILGYEMIYQKVYILVEPGDSNPLFKHTLLKKDFMTYLLMMYWMIDYK